MPISVGVDLGSTHCNVGVWHQNRPEVIANDHGLRATPTMVAFSDSEVLVGEAALTQMPKNVANTVTGFKPMVGQSHAELPPHVKKMLEAAPFRSSVASGGESKITVTHKGEERVMAPETLCGYLLEHLKGTAEAFAGESVGRCVLSVPASFSSEQRDALRAVGKQAGLPFSLVITDAVACAIAHGLDRPDEEMEATRREGQSPFRPAATIVVVDWGGGGVDATVVRRTDGALAVTGQAADAAAAGGVFTERLVAFCAKDFKRRTGGNIFESKRSLLKVTRGCEEAVRTLSASAQANVYVEAAHEGCDMNVKISRTRFEDLCFDLYKAAGGVITKALADAGTKPEEVDTVLLAGGIAHMPKVTASVKAYFPEGTSFGSGVVPDEAIATGATIQAFLLQEHASFVAPGAAPLPRVIRTCPCGIGVRCGGADDAGDDHEMTSLIRQGSILPVQGTSDVRLAPSNGGGPSVIEIVEISRSGEGEPPSVRPIGCMSFDGIDGGSGDGFEVRVGCTLRSEGVLKVEAVEVGSGTQRELVIGHGDS